MTPAETLPDLLRIARTARPMRLRQVAYRILRRVQPLRPRGATTPAVTPPDRAGELRPAIERLASILPAPDLQRMRAAAEGRFRFLNHEEHLPAVDWRVRHVSHLWNYNLHYFDYALDLALAWRETREPHFADAFVRLATSWIDATRDGAGDGWQPYALSLRIVNWCYALALFGDAIPEHDRAAITASLHQQAEALSHRLEWHIQANHLQKNLHALLVAGLFFATPDAERWKSLALRSLWRQLEEQVLADGGHYERSPMYHAIALGDFLEDVLLLRAAGDMVPEPALLRLRHMTSALRRLSRPDGTPHLLNDSAAGIAPPLPRLERMAALALGEVPTDEHRRWSLPLTGYHGAQAGEALLLLDCGEPGPAHQPGHAHCDLLSYVLELGGAPFIVDSGVHGYDGDPYREYVRSTRAHNTVMIGGREQSEVWATFRMARRARVLSATSLVEAGAYRFRGAYRPFHDRRAVHERVFTLDDASFSVADVVRGAAGRVVEGFIHLHPDVQASVEGHRVLFSGPKVGGEIEVTGCDEVAVTRGEMHPVQGWYCPEFGIARPSSVVTMRVARNRGDAFGYRVVWHRESMEATT